jgi:hypothetical protein
MEWVYLSILRSTIIVGFIMFIKYDDAPKYIFPVLINILVGFISLIYFIYFYSNDKNIKDIITKPKYYIYSIILFFVTLLGYYIIKISPNPAYFRTFAVFEIILLLLLTLYYNKIFYINYQGILGIIFGCISIILITVDNII